MATRLPRDFKEFLKLLDQLLLESGNIIRMGHPPMRLEILTQISGLEFDPAFKRRTVDQIDGQTINLISLKDLKINKRAAGRPKDLDDLSKLAAKPKR